MSEATVCPDQTVIILVQKETVVLKTKATILKMEKFKMSWSGCFMFVH